MSRLSKQEASELVTSIIGSTAVSSGGNWLKVRSNRGAFEVYYSQCKPAAASKGKWTYDFFHTLAFETVQDIGTRSGILVLLNYVDKTFVVLDAADLMWVVKYSSRQKSNAGVVCDFVVDREVSGDYNLRPYDRQRTERRHIEVKEW